jgi:POT family proton-dependent oligopeptide transporter
MQLRKDARSRLMISLGRLAMLAVAGVVAYFYFPAATGQGPAAPEAQDYAAPAADQGAEPKPATDSLEPAPTPRAPAPVAAPAEPALAPTPAPPTQESKTNAYAVALLKALSSRVGLEEPAALSADDFNGVTDDYRKTLKEGLGKEIHKLRKHGFVPFKSVLWREITVAEGKTALYGIIKLQDNRPRGVKVKVGRDGRIEGFARPTWKEVPLRDTVEAFMEHVRAGKIEDAWKSGSKEMQGLRDVAALGSDLKAGGFGAYEAFDWSEGNGIEVAGGYRVDGELKLADEKNNPFYAVVVEEDDGYRMLDIRTTQSVITRIRSGEGNPLDHMVFVVLLGVLLGLVYILWSYARGLKGSPYELYCLFFTKVTEYSAYGAANLTFVIYLRDDIGLGDIGAGTYVGAWSTVLTFITIMVGPVCDAIGVKKTLIIGAVALMFSRLFMPFMDGFWGATLVGFVPLALGIAITGPVLSVGIKRFTTREGAALGFGLFYTLMNVGWAVGAWLFDYIRLQMGDTGSYNLFGSELSVYQVIIGIGFFINIPDLIAILLMRDNVEMTETGIKIHPKPERVKGQGLMARMVNATTEAAKGTAKIFGENFVQKSFWVFIFLIGVTVFTRLVFFHFHFTWPSYGIRYFGLGSLIGSIFGVLNPVMIVFLVPLFAAMTRKVSSYWMLLVGTVISVVSIIFVILPPETFAWMGDTWLGTVIFDRWLEVPVGRRDPFYISMVLFVFSFTIGEAIWSPRLMQFTAEIAPPGREGSYVALAYLPYFGAKLIAGPMAGFLLAGYVPEFGIDGVHHNYPDHQTIWLWIGGMAALTPVCLFFFKRLYLEAEERAAEAAAAASAQELKEAAEKGEGF